MSYELYKPMIEHATRNSQSVTRNSNDIVLCRIDDQPIMIV